MWCMSELRPQFTFSPEGELHIRTGLEEDRLFISEEANDYDDDRLEQREDILETMAGASGVEAEQNRDIVDIRVDVERRFGTSFLTHEQPKTAVFLKQLDDLLPFNPDDDIDRVLSMSAVSNRGVKAQVNQHFQRWLNSGGLNEAVAFDTTQALALPFGAFVCAKAKAGFSYHDVGHIHGAHANEIGIMVREQQQFGIESIGPPEQAYRFGSALWSDLELITLNDYPRIASSVMERDNVVIDGRSQRLYQLETYGVESAQQSMSILLGLGALAYHAARYEGQEDLLSSVSWNETA